MAAAGRRAAATALALLGHGARAQLYKLQDVAMPMGVPYSLEVLYTFYVYSHDDSPESALPDDPYVRMSLWTKVSSLSEGCEPTGYSGVQMSLVPRRQFWQLVDPKQFCDTQKMQLSLTKDKADPGVWPGLTHNVTGQAGSEAKTNLPATGAYYLVLSNCGSCVDQKVSGEVELRNTYGYLPANEYYKKQFYEFLLVAFAVTVVLWVVQLARWSAHIHAIHHCLTVVLVCAVAEALMQRALLTSWNFEGSFAPWMLCCANLASVLKTGFCYTMVCYIAQGWGVTQESLASVTKTKVEVFACLYLPLQYMFEGMLAFRHTHHLSTTFLVMLWVPSAVLVGTVFCWIFGGLIETLESASKTQQPGLLTLLRRLGKLMTVMAVFTLVDLVFKVLDISTNEPPKSWHVQWILAEGVQDVLFVVVIAMTMFILAPFRNMKEYLYTTSVSANEFDADVIGAEAPAVWADEDGDGILDDDDAKDDGEGFWTMTRTANRSGAGARDERQEPRPEAKTGMADHDLLG